MSFSRTETESYSHQHSPRTRDLLSVLVLLSVSNLYLDVIDLALSYMPFARRWRLRGVRGSPEDARGIVDSQNGYTSKTARWVLECSHCLSPIDRNFGFTANRTRSEVLIFLHTNRYRSQSARFRFHGLLHWPRVWCESPRTVAWPLATPGHPLVSPRSLLRRRRLPRGMLSPRDHSVSLAPIGIPWMKFHLVSDRSTAIVVRKISSKVKTYGSLRK